MAGQLGKCGTEQLGTVGPKMGVRMFPAVNERQRTSRNEKAPTGGAFKGFFVLLRKPKNPVLAGERSYQKALKPLLYNGFDFLILICAPKCAPKC